MYIPPSVSQQMSLVNVTDFGTAILTQLQEMDVHNVKGLELLLQKLEVLSQKMELFSPKIDLLSQEIANSSMKRGFYIALACGGTLGLVLRLVLLIRRRHFHLADTLEFNDSQQNEYTEAQHKWAAENLAGTLVRDSAGPPE